MKKVLIIEDDITKINRLKEFFNSENVTLKESFQAGVLELKNNFSKYDFLILDMTIPLWEKGNNDLGGNYEQFGGEKVLREMKRRKLILPTILFTMFDVFPTIDGSTTFDEINLTYKNDFPSIYIGGVLFKSNEENWQAHLKELILSINNE